jgi:hypothetical protein
MTTAVEERLLPGGRRRGGGTAGGLAALAEGRPVRVPDPGALLEALRPVLSRR